MTPRDALRASGRDAEWLGHAIPATNGHYRVNLPALQPEQLADLMNLMLDGWHCTVAPRSARFVTARLTPPARQAAA